MRSVALKRFCDVITRGSTPTYSTGDEGDALVVGQSCQRPDGRFELDRGRFHVGPVPSKGLLQGGEVLINSTGTGTLGRCALVGSLPDALPVFVDSHVTMLRVDARRADARFVNYSIGLPSSRRYIEDALSVGATKQRELNVDALRAHRVALPDLTAQLRAADFLDKESHRIETLRAELENYSLLLEEPALAEFARLTQDLPLVRVGYGYEVQLGKMLDAARQTSGVEVPYLRNSNLDWDRIDLDDVKTMRLTEDELDRYAIRPGDLLACEGRHVGKCAIWPEGAGTMYYQKALHRIRPRADQSNRFMLWFLWLGNSRGDFYADGTGSTIPHLPAEKLRALNMPLASRSRQDEIVATVDAIHSRTRRLRQEAQEAAAALSEYRDALITEAVNGRLDLKAMGDARMAESLHAVREGESPEVLAS